ncbi:transposase family protein [Streptomyces solicathayae]|uniref:Transposase family protein n=1 Tax=Streptomyces solicathayae TaxID=3081768 RepID=A0ABZ0LNE7_9ACTN|nr:transposase family protein [Streptomyces sp. HUAS YS2]WOX20339.1 transposase family protein [Streptomyces sp. HUAS YS2]
MQTDAPFWDSLVFEGIDDVDVEAVTAAFGSVEVVARGRAAGSPCPDCDRFADRVHDRYQRRLKDLPFADQGFVIRLTVRRFICGSAGCPRRTCAEPFSRLAARMHGSLRGSTTLWSVWGSRWPGGPELVWLPNWASARDG